MTPLMTQAQLEAISDAELLAHIKALEAEAGRRLGKLVGVIRNIAEPVPHQQRITFSVPLTPQTHTSGHVPLMQSALSPEQFNAYVGTIEVK